MNKFRKHFVWQYEHYLDEQNFSIEFTKYPKKLLQQLDPQSKTSKFKHFLNRIKCSERKQSWKFWKSSTKPGQRKDALHSTVELIRTQLDDPEQQVLDGYYVLRILSLLSYLLLYSNKYYSIIPEILPLHQKCSHSDKWLVKNYLKPYQKYLLKCCSSYEQYQQFRVQFLNGVCEPYKLTVQLSKTSFSNKSLISLENIFYLLNLLNTLFQSMDNISTLGRYFQSNMINNFVHIGSFHCVRLYISLKIILKEIIQNRNIYVKKQNEQIFKLLFRDNIPQINEKIKVLLLNKYFLPFLKGIKTGLFLIEQLTSRSRDYLQQLIETDEQKHHKYKRQSIKNMLIAVTASSENMSEQFVEKTPFKSALLRNINPLLLKSNTKTKNNNTFILRKENMVDEIDIGYSSLKNIKQTIVGLNQQSNDIAEQQQEE